MLQVVQLGKGLMLPQVDLQRGPQGPGQGAREQPSSTPFPKRTLLCLGNTPINAQAAVREQVTWESASVCILPPCAPWQGVHVLECINAYTLRHAHTAHVHTPPQCTQDSYAHKGAVHTCMQCTCTYMHRCMYTDAHTCTCTRTPPEYRAQAEMAVPAGNFWQQRLPNPSPMKFP